MLLVLAPGGRDMERGIGGGMRTDVAPAVEDDGPVIAGRLI